METIENIHKLVENPKEDLEKPEELKNMGLKFQKKE